MKLAIGNPAATREGRTEQLRRDRADSQAMRAAFPAVRQLRIELKFEDSRPNTPTSQSHELYPAARAFFTYPCPYAGCDGHFDLHTAVRRAIEGELHFTKGTIACGGLRARDHSSKEACLLRLHYEIRVKYDENRGEERERNGA